MNKLIIISVPPAIYFFVELVCKHFRRYCSLVAKKNQIHHITDSASVFRWET